MPTLPTADDQTTILAVKRSRAWIGPVLPVLVGLLFWLTPLGKGLKGLSYDLLFFLKPTVRPEEAVIVYLDEKSFRELRQQPSNWDRSLHARLLERMTADQARVVVFDVWFTDPGLPAPSEELRRAMKDNGRVVLAATLSSNTQPGLRQRSLLRPLAMFREAATNWGIAELAADRQAIVRQCYPNSELGLSLPWAAALAAGCAAVPDQGGSYWLNYYGPQGTISSVSFCDVTNQAPGYFRNKAVFIGARPTTLYAFEQSDEFRTPYARWGGAYFPGVEILATGYLNLERNERLTQLSPILQFLIILGGGLLLGWGADRLKPMQTVALTGEVVLGLAAAVLALHWLQHAWFPWLVVAGIQVPSALAWKLGGFLAKRQAAPDLSPFLTFDGKRRVPNVPDHTLICNIGRGAYGEVWLARNTIGMFHAVKFVFRDRYPSPDPYNREFRGIKNYMPVSLKHPALVHVLHVGRNDRGGYFFYIMEAGDDEVSGQQIDPARYKPKNLAGELSKRGRCSVEACVSLGLHLTSALNYLHGQRLIHRDIKPSNIIYVSGTPKLADVGLVTTIASEGRVLTYVGTEGYIPPEGPGTAGGDVYSLGKVLYEASMGRDRLRYPDLPTNVVEGNAQPGLLQLNEIILKACESDPSRRYQSAATIHAHLLRLQEWLADGALGRATGSAAPAPPPAA